MFRLGIDGFIRNITKNIMVILQLTMILVLSTLIVSTYDSQTRMSKAVMKYIDETGAYIYPDMSRWDEDKVMSMPGFKEHIYALGMNTSVYLEGYDKESGGNCDFITYDEDKVNYRPRLKSGKWYSEVGEKDNTINVVIAENDYGYGVGDRLKVKLLCNDGTEKQIDFYVTGVVYDRSMLFGFNNEYNNSNNSYVSLFSNTVDYESGINKQYSFAVTMSLDDIEKYNIYVTQRKGIIDFDDDISEEQMNKNIAQLNEMAMASSTAGMKSNSDEILFSKLAGIFIVFIVIVIITIASIICSGAVTYMYERRNYGIYYMTGNTWMNTVLLSLINWLMVALSSVVLCIFIISMGVLFKYFDTYTISYSLKTFVVQFLIVALMILTAMLIPYVKTKKSQPVDIIKNNE